MTPLRLILFGSGFIIVLAIIFHRQLAAAIPIRYALLVALGVLVAIFSERAAKKIADVRRKLPI